ncbi:MAG: Rid family detoxifying hydrolase [Thermoplasmata archaeon]|nr:Rid family detoxifying hydrolase [Thermoplasmata archaeon]
MKQISTPNAPVAIGPYSQGIRTGNLIFTSMQIPINPDNDSIPEDIEAQTGQVLENLKAIAEAGGSSMAKAVKLTLYLRDMDDFQAVNQVYAGFFDNARPARAAVEVSRLPRNVLIAMDAVFEVG